MGRRDELISKYAADLREKCRITPDMALLTKVTLGCGPLIYDAQTEVLASDAAERAAIRKNFLLRKLGLPASPALDEALEAALDTYGPAEPQKYRAVVYYMLTRHFGRESAFR